MFHALRERTRRQHAAVKALVRDLKFNDIYGSACILQRGVFLMPQRAEAYTDPKRSFAAQKAHQRQCDFTHGHGILTRLDVDIRDAGRAILNQQFRKLVQFRAITAQFAILAAHPAIGTVLPAVIGNLHHPANKNPRAETARGGDGSPLMQRFLSFAAGVQVVRARNELSINHGVELTQRDGQAQARSTQPGLLIKHCSGPCFIAIVS